MTLSDLRRYLDLSNVAAFLRVIRERESSQDDSAYTVLNGGSHFFDFAAHPYKGQRTPPGKAAGAYQFIASTWGDVEQQYGMPDFSPGSQDAGAVARLVYRGALDDVMAGRFEQAVAKCRLEWTSLPGAAESSGSWTMAKALAVFKQYGGRTAAELATLRPGGVPTATPQPPAAAGPPIQQETPRMGTIALPLLAQLIPQVLGLFTARAQATIAEKTGADPKLAADLMQAVITQVGNAVGVPVVDGASATSAVGALNALPPEVKAAQVKTLEAQALATVDALLKAGDKMAAWDAAKWEAELRGRKGSSEIAIAERQAGLWDMTPWLVGVAGATSSICSALLLFAIVYQSIWAQKGIDAVLLGLAGPLLAISFAAWKAIFDYRFDGTKESTEQSKALINALPRQGASQ